MKTRYKIKGIGSEQTIESVIKIFTNQEGKIAEVQDRWNGNLPEGAVAKVCCAILLGCDVGEELGRGKRMGKSGWLMRYV